jgi:hypothetical protein
MSQDVTDLKPTSTATTKETEPEIVAGIASGDISPNQPLSFRTGSGEWRYARPLLMLAAGLAVGYGAARWLRHRG